MLMLLKVNLISPEVTLRYADIKSYFLYFEEKQVVVYDSNRENLEV